MKRSAIILALALGVSAWSLTAQDQGTPPPAGQRPPPEAGAQGGPGRGPGGPGGFHVLPPRAQEQLNLTDDPKKQVAALEAEVKAKIEQILTPEQLKQLKEMRPPQRQGGPGGFGGSGGEGRPQRPPQEQ